VRVFALSLAICGFCFAQDDPQRATVHQVSNGTCSVNLSGVHGNVNISFSGPACNGFSENLLHQVLERLDSLDNKFNSYPASSACGGVPSITSTYDLLSIGTGKPADFVGSLLAGTDPTTPPQSLIGLWADGHIAGLDTQPSTGWTFGGVPSITSTYDLSSIGTSKPVDFVGSLFSGTDPTTPSQNLIRLTTDGHIAGLDMQPPTRWIFPATGTDGTSYNTLSITITKPVDFIGSLLAGTDPTTPSQNLIRLWADGHIAGLDTQPSTGWTFGGVPSITSTYDLSSIGTSKPVDFVGSPLAGIDMSTPSQNLIRLWADGHIAGLDTQPSTGWTFGGAPSITSTYDLSSIGTSKPVDFGSVLSGTDYLSLSKSLSELTSHGRIITGWTLTYLESEPAKSIEPK